MPHGEMGVKILETTQEEKESQEEEESPALIEKSFAPRVVKEKARPLKICTLQEAVMKMELSGDRFLIFRSEEEQRLKVIYRRHDQSYGVMSIE